MTLLERETVCVAVGDDSVVVDHDRSTAAGPGGVANPVGVVTSLTVLRGIVNVVVAEDVRIRLC